MELYPAHIKPADAGHTTDHIQSVSEHCRATAAYAAEALNPAGLSESAYLAGLLHDCGKFTQEFRNYIIMASHGQHVRKGSVNHTFSGCRLLLEHFHSNQQTNDYQNVTCELLAYAVGAHHGLFDCIDTHGNSGFLHRLNKENIGYEESSQQFISLCASWPELEQRFAKAHSELLPIYEKLIALRQETQDESGKQLMFSIGQLARLLLSAVIEGDRRDTAEFMNLVPSQPKVSDYHAFWNNYLSHMEHKLHSFPQDTQIQKARSTISELCRAASEKPAGIYRLNVPTGGGKTLSSLRYALAHAARWGKQRIIFVTPLLTILEQNASVIRDFIGDSSIILEHHSNVLHTESTGEALDLRELAVNSWNSPVIITTLVQFLNTLFLGKTTSIRRYQALCNAVVVIDEVQTVPNHMLSLFNTAVNFLSAVCGTTFLLCSATQPCFDEAEHPLIPSEELIPYNKALWQPFQRTKLQDAGGLRLEQIPEFAKQTLQGVNSLLVICNKKSESEFLFSKLTQENVNCFHLSSSMCMAHRRDTLSQIEASLSIGRKTVCISTQIMEAGVDISFDCVIRLAAGMDSVVQSAGRCNRNGESNQTAPVYILQCTDESLGRLREIQTGKQVTISLLEQFRQHPEQFQNDLASSPSIEWYYRKLYREQKSSKGYQQFAVKGHETLFQLLSSNEDNINFEDPYFMVYTMNQAFQTAGSLFHVLDDATEDVVVPYGKGASLITELTGHIGDVSPEYLRAWSERAKPYTVSVYHYQKENLEAGLLESHGVLVLHPEYYNIQTGLITKPETGFLEV